MQKFINNDPERMRQREDFSLALVQKMGYLLAVLLVALLVLIGRAFYLSKDTDENRAVTIRTQKAPAGSTPRFTKEEIRLLVGERWDKYLAREAARKQ